MEPEGSLQCSQELASGPHAQADEYNSPQSSIAFHIHVITIVIILPDTPRSSRRYLSFSSCQQNSVVFTSFPCLTHAQSTSFFLIHLTDSLWAGRSGDRIPVGARFSAPVQTGPGAHPASYTMGTGSFPGIKRPRRGVDHPPHLALRLKKE